MLKIEEKKSKTQMKEKKDQMKRKGGGEKKTVDRREPMRRFATFTQTQKNPCEDTSGGEQTPNNKKLSCR